MRSYLFITKCGVVNYFPHTARSSGEEKERGEGREGEERSEIYSRRLAPLFFLTILFFSIRRRRKRYRSQSLPLNDFYSPDLGLF